jgi:hypothetical protein
LYATDFPLCFPPKGFDCNLEDGGTKEEKVLCKYEQDFARVWKFIATPFRTSYSLPYTRIAEHFTNINLKEHYSTA